MGGPYTLTGHVELIQLDVIPSTANQHWADSSSLKYLMFQIFCKTNIIKFYKIKNIINLAILYFTDVIGIVKSVGDMSTVQSKASNREIKKRDIQLVDKSGVIIRMTLWGAEVSLMLSSVDRGSGFQVESDICM